MGRIVRCSDDGSSVRACIYLYGFYEVSVTSVVNMRWLGKMQRRWR